MRAASSHHVTLPSCACYDCRSVRFETRPSFNPDHTQRHVATAFCLGSPAGPAQSLPGCVAGARTEPFTVWSPPPHSAPSTQEMWEPDERSRAAHGALCAQQHPWELRRWKTRSWAPGIPWTVRTRVRADMRTGTCRDDRGHRASLDEPRPVQWRPCLPGSTELDEQD